MTGVQRLLHLPGKKLPSWESQAQLPICEYCLNTWSRPPAHSGNFNSSTLLGSSVLLCFCYSCLNGKYLSKVNCIPAAAFSFVIIPLQQQRTDLYFLFTGHWWTLCHRDAWAELLKVAKKKGNLECFRGFASNLKISTADKMNDVMGIGKTSHSSEYSFIWFMLSFSEPDEASGVTKHMTENQRLASHLLHVLRKTSQASGYLGSCRISQDDQNMWWLRMGLETTWSNIWQVRSEAQSKPMAFLISHPHSSWTKD